MIYEKIKLSSIMTSKNHLSSIVQHLNFFLLLIIYYQFIQLIMYLKILSRNKNYYFHKDSLQIINYLGQTIYH